MVSCIVLMRGGRKLVVARIQVDLGWCWHANRARAMYSPSNTNI